MLNTITAEELVKKLDSGEIHATGKLPARFLENESLVDPDSNDGQRFQKVMEGLTKKLWPNWDFNKDPVKFLLRDDAENIDAYVMPGQKPNLMVFSKAMLDFAKSEDELVYILGHELNHILIAKEYGMAYITEPEEMMADLRHLKQMITVGYNPFAGRDFAARLHDHFEHGDDDDDSAKTDKHRSRYDSPVLRNMLLAIADEHAGPSFRASYINNFISGVAKLDGGEAGYESRPKAPMPDEIIDLSKNAKHESYFSKLEIDTGDGRAFKDLSVIEQLAFIEKHVSDVEEGFEERPKKLAEWFENTDSDPRVESHRAAGERIFAKMLDHPAALNDMYELILMNMFDKESFEPIGPFADMSVNLQKAVDAKSKDDFAEASKQIVDIYKKYPTFDYKTLNLPSFELPKKQKLLEYDPKYVNKGRPLPWNQQVTWALEQLEKDNDFSMGHALLLMGVQDKRLYDACPIELFKDVLKKSVGPWSTGYGVTSPSGAMIDHLAINFNDGTITNVVKGNHMPSSLKAWNPGEYLETLQPRKFFSRDIITLQDPLPAVEAGTNEDFRGNFAKWMEQNDAKLRVPEAYSMEITYRGSAIFGKTDTMVKSGLQAINVAAADENGPESLVGANKEVYELLYKPYAANAQVLINQFEQMLKTGGDAERQFVRHFFLDNKSKDTMAYLLSKRSHHKNEVAQYDYIDPLPINFPYNDFISKNAHDLFTKAEQAEILSKSCMIPSDNDKWWQQTIGYEPPAKRSDLLNTLKKFEPFLASKKVKPTDTTLVQVCKLAEQYFTYDKSKLEKLNLPELLTECPSVIKHISNETFYAEMYGGGEWVSYSSYITHRVGKVKNWPDDPEKLAQIYKTLENDNLFPSMDWQNEFTARLQKSIEDEPSKEKKIKAVETLLFGTNLKNTSLRKLAFTEWTNVILEGQKAKGLGIDGKDDGSAAYSDSLNDIIKRVKEESQTSTGIEMLATLAAKLETQRELSYRFRDTYKLNKETMEKADMPIRMGEALMVLFAESEDDRKTCIDFLISPASPENLKKLGKRLNKSINNLYNYGAGVITVQQDQIRSLFQQNREEDYYTITAKDLHENYWNLPLAGRAAIMDELLVPSDDRYYGDKSAVVAGSKAEKRVNASEEAYQNAYTMVLDRLMPEKMNYGKEARKFMETYRSVIPESQRNLFLAVMLSVEKAVQESGQSEVSIGRRLSMVLDMMGPAERKLGQAIHSHPQTPDDIREDMGELKYKASPGTRWEAWEDFDRSVHPDYQKHIKRLGKFLGSASYFKSFEVQRNDGSDGVIQFQRPNVMAQAQEGFRLLEKFVGELRVQGQGSEEICDVMTDMLSQAKKMSGTETSSDIGAEQIKAAQQIYNGVKVQVGEHKFTFKTADWRAYGPEFRDQEKMPGVHFNELPEASADDLSYKRAVAKAYIALEFRNLLSGKGFDHDRHGAQLKVDRSKNQIGLFDHGAFHAEVYKRDGSLATPWEPGKAESDNYQKVLAEGGRVAVPDPTDDEKRLLANTLFTALTRYLEHKTPMAQTLYDEIRHIKKTEGHIPEHLVRVQRALLALNDFVGIKSGAKKQAMPDIAGEAPTPVTQAAQYVNEQDMVDVLQGLFQDKERGHIDPIIKECLDEKMRPFKRKQAMKYVGGMFKKLVGGKGHDLPKFEAVEDVIITQEKTKAPLPPASYDAPPPKDPLDDEKSESKSQEQTTGKAGAKKVLAAMDDDSPAALRKERPKKPGSYRDLAAERDNSQDIAFKS